MDIFAIPGECIVSIRIVMFSNQIEYLLIKQIEVIDQLGIKQK